MRHLIGSDEVGYGALAGPLVVCAVAVPIAGWKPPRGLDDSKRMSPSKRLRVSMALKLDPQLMSSVIFVQATSIDRVGIATALRDAHMAAIQNMLKRARNARVIIDGEFNWIIPKTWHFKKKADQCVPAVMAASVIAKVTRDEHMMKLGQKYERYGFSSHKGYGSEAHITAINSFGAINGIHRMSFKPCSKKSVEK